MSRHIYELSDKEEQTLKLYLAGLSYQDMDEKLHITRKYLSYRLSTIKDKLDVHNFAEIRDKAIELRYC